MEKSKDNNNLIIYMIKTDKGCFISDCKVMYGYDYNYHSSKIKNLYFDGVKPKESYLKNWYIIDKYPSKIQRLEGDKRINSRYILRNPEMESKALPLEVSYNQLDYDDPTYGLYELKYDIQKGGFKDVEDIEIKVISEIVNFELPPVINYKTIQKVGYDNREVILTNKDIEHQILDKLVIPEFAIHGYPCEISSTNLYHIVRQYIKDNIDTKYAKITSDYDFCFTVKKLIPLHSPKNYSYTNPFARTKKEKAKIHYGVSEYKEVEIFEMTHDQSKYKGYTSITPIKANSHKELKEKIDKYLEDLIEYINEPLVECEHCKGTGWINELKR